MSNIGVFMNGKLIDHIDSKSLGAYKRWIKQHLLSTHMGEWHQTQDGYHYITTIGQYYEFRKIKKEERLSR